MIGELPKSDLYPCPTCGSPYSLHDPGVWHVDPHVCKNCRKTYKATNVVFVVGPDMTGKTQIATALAKRLNVPYYKASAEHASFLGRQDRFINDIRFACPARFDLLKQQLDQGFINGIVYDRGYPCEWVYSRFFGRPSDVASVKRLDEQYATLGSRIIMTTRRSFAGIRDDLNDNIEAAELERLSGLYDEFAQQEWGHARCPIMKLYVDDENLERELQDIMAFLGNV